MHHPLREWNADTRGHQPLFGQLHEVGGHRSDIGVYILDEPTTGLHFHDVAKLLEMLQELVNQGNSVVVIEHNLEVIKTADWVIDFGPEGGDGGGEIVATGTPEDIVKEERSYTGQFLKELLERRPMKKVQAAE